MSNPKLLIFAAISCLAFCGLALAIGVPEPNKPNLNNDDRADFLDFAIMGNNWQQAGTKLEGDLDDSNFVDINDLMVFCWYWLDEYSEYQQCRAVDLDNDGIIAFEDIAKLAQNWILEGVGFAGDFDKSNLVDCNDLSIMADCWLKGSRPETVFEQFKADLAAGDVNTAISFISEASRDEYAAFFQIIGTGLPDYAAGMGDMVLVSSEADEAIYEMSHDEGGGVIASYPVYFCRDENGNWKINRF